MASAITFDVIWNQALDKYLTATNRTSDETAYLRSLHGPDDLFKQLEEDSNKFESYRDKNKRFRNVLSKCAASFLVLSEVVSPALSLCPFAPASTTIGAMVFLVKAAKGVSEVYDWIEQLFDKLGGFSQRLEEYASGSMSANLQKKVVEILDCLLEILAQSEQVVKDGRFKQYAAVLFLGKDTKVNDSFSKLAKLLDDEQRLVQAISYATNQRVEMKVDDIHMTSNAVLETTAQMDARLELISLSIKGIVISRFST
jgi:fungal STAND N-terminal Goodbye domain